MAEIESYPFQSGPRGCPAHEWDARRRDDPLGPVRLPSGDVVTLAVRHDDVAAVLIDPRFSRELFYPGAPRMFDGFDLAALPDTLLSMDPPRHTRMRRLLSGTFTPRQVESWRPRVRAIARDLLTALPAGFDLVDDFAFPLPIQIMCDVMGVAGIDVARVRGWSEAMLSTSSLPPEEKVAAAAEFHAYTTELIATHRDDPGDGLLASMIRARDEGDRLTDEELVINTIGLFLAGHETTASLLARAMLRLLDPRDGYERLVAEPELAGTAVEELLRVESPALAAFLRVATEDVELPSGTVRKGEGVIAGLAGANHDPTAFTEAGALVLDREGPPHLAFGRGPHFCLGANLARMELREILTVLTELAPGLTLAVPAGEVPWTEGTLVHRPTRLLVRR
ncbi:cytochrome P450 [Microtetraspora sp. NBRC 13810]|uniref:cytochrome P450 n=1 Tax=Microtetraspora sp. NBRC 13810 TaxID=3030990 RepID=UPI0024A2F231|nr:cytochrome P450 [Microtetraspora sp. NBRC 13810]GLW10936.1 cytochrome P450 [Microtetraspora sp. NBRC 13810]